MVSALFDTTVFIDYWRGDVAAKQLVGQMIQGHMAVHLCPITAIELWQSPRMGRKEEIEFAAFLTLMRAAPMSVDTGREVGIALRSLSRSQRRRLMADAIIATTAKQLGAAVHTRNVKDLSRFHNNVQRY